MLQKRAVPHSIQRTNTSLCLFHVAEFALILQKLGEWYENLPLVPVTRVLYRIISVHALKCVPKAMHTSMHCVVMPSVILLMTC